MALRQVMETLDLLDHPEASGPYLREAVADREFKGDLQTREVSTDKGKTDFVCFRFPGCRGKSQGGDAPTFGLIGRLGGIGARPERIGLVSDGDGAITAVSAAFKLGQMAARGDVLEGDVIVTTHICPCAPVRPHHPVPFMDSPVDLATMNKHEVLPEMDCILSVDTSRGNRIINRRGFAVSPTVKEGFILKVSDDLLDTMEVVTGKPAQVLPITMQDITPYGNGVFHINSILQPSCATSSPVVGVALTAEVPVPGCASGASHPVDIEMAVRFVIEAAKGFTSGSLRLYDPGEFENMVRLYGAMTHLQTLGKLRVG